MSDTRFLVALMLLGVNCRWGFELSHNAPPDASPDVSTDAGVPCVPLPAGTSVADCAAARMNLAAASDQRVYDCAISCLLDGCTIYDASTCSSCACNAYATSKELCSPTGGCMAPISGTGCIGGNYYAGAPFNCPSTLGQVGEGACMMRVLWAGGYCN